MSRARKGTIVFHEEDHSYWLGERQLISVTQLLSKHGISPDLSKVSQKLLRKKAEHGTMVHKEIEDFIKTGERGISDEFQDFLKLVLPLAEVWESEVMVWTNDYAGTCDLVGKRGDTIIIVDTKTGNVDRLSTAWQVGLYGYAMPAVRGNENVEFYVFDAKMNGESRLTRLQRISDTAIKALIRAEKAGKVYNPMTKVVKSDRRFLPTERRIAEMEIHLKELKDRRDGLWAGIKEKMEFYGVSSFDTPHLHVAYVAPYMKESFDTKRFKEDEPEKYAEYVKESPVKGSLRISVKEVADGQNG